MGDPTNTKGGKSKTIKAKDERHTQQRMAITDNLVTYDRVREKFLSSKEEVPPGLLANIAEAKKKLAEHDKQHEQDNSIRTIAEVADKFYQLDQAVTAIQERILDQTICLAHEVATRELQLEKLVAECNEKKEQRKIARARGHESTITSEELDMEHVVEKLRVMEIALPEGTL